MAMYAQTLPGKALISGQSESTVGPHEVPGLMQADHMSINFSEGGGVKATCEWSGLHPS